MGRVSKEQAGKNREKVVATASELFRRRGIAAVNITDIMSAASLTHGGFYNQFGSKEALAAEAVEFAFDKALEAWRANDRGSGRERRSRLARLYLRSAAPDACPLPTLGSEVAQSAPDSDLRKAYADGLTQFADLLNRDAADDRGLALLAALVGARVLRRASNDTSLADEIDAAVIAMSERDG